MVSTPEGFTEISPMSPGPYTTFKNPLARKPICQFLEALEAKQNTAVCRLGPDKSRRKAIRAGSILWSMIQNRNRRT